MPHYPRYISTQNEKVSAHLSNDGYRVEFPFSEEAVACAKEVLKAPKFDRYRKCWVVNKRWHKDMPDALAAIARVVTAQQIEADAHRVAQRKAQLARDAEGRTAFEAMKPYTSGINATISGERIVFATAYHDCIVALFRRLDGKFLPDSKRWSLPLSAGVEIAENRDAIARWHNQTVDEKSAGSHAKAQKKAMRKLVRIEDAPSVGSVVRVHDAWQKVASHGKVFRGNEDTSSIGGPIGSEGDPIRYIYFTAPTAEEITEAERLEQQDTAAQEARVRLGHTLTAIANGELAPDTGAAPEGEILWREDTQSGTGLTRSVVLANGWLYHIVYDGSDGAMWGDYNAGYNTTATRIPATDEIVQVLRNTGDPSE